MNVHIMQLFFSYIFLILNGQWKRRSPGFFFILSIIIPTKEKQNYEKMFKNLIFYQMQAGVSFVDVVELFRGYLTIILKRGKQKKAGIAAKIEKQDVTFLGGGGVGPGVASP